MRDRLSSIHNNMKARCYNPNCISYKRYGERGITICDEWRNSEKMGKYSKGYLSFKEWALSHGYKEGLTIDRVDNNKGYSPDNCRWLSHNYDKRRRHNYCLGTWKKNGGVNDKIFS